MRYNLKTWRADMVDLTKNPAYQDLVSAASTMQQTSLAQLMQHDLQRSKQMQISAAGLHLNYANHLVDKNCLQGLIKLAESADLRAAIECLFKGNIVNITEQSAALHTALRDHQRGEVKAALDKMATLVNAIRSQQYQGITGKPITHIINLGVGGSHLGPAMATQALGDFESAPQTFDFISHYDPHYLQKKLTHLNPETTLCIVASKSFSTHETLANATLIKQWFVDCLGETAIEKHMLAVTAKTQLALAFGVSEPHILPMWSWVGGRYSLWSCVGLSLAIAIGMDGFHQLLQGAYAMDQHFRHADFASNMPVIMALLTVWYNHFFQCQSKAIIPYAQQLELFPAYLQQLVMESLGKSTNQQGELIAYHTGSIVWGGVGTDSQHSFHQLLLQGNQFVAIDFILPLATIDGESRDYAIANCLAQQELLATGYHAKQAFRSIAGNMPSNLITMPELTAKTLGALIAAYEHSVYVQSVIWNINAFDQWGVERGKILASEKLHHMQSMTKELEEHAIPD